MPMEALSLQHHHHVVTPYHASGGWT